MEKRQPMCIVCNSSTMLNIVLDIVDGSIMGCSNSTNSSNMCAKIVQLWDLPVLSARS